MRKLLGETVVEDWGEPEGDEESGEELDTHALAQQIAAAVESQKKDVSPREVLASLKYLAVGQGKTMMMSLLRRETKSKAKKSAMTLRKEV
jgi:hypothetical protein